jgi:hypothetical protein
MTILLFCVESPDLSLVPRIEQGIVVPMRWELELDPCLAGYDLIDPARWRSIELSNRIQLKLDRAWDSMLSVGEDDLIRDYPYPFYNAMSAIMFWRHIVQSALNEYKPTIVYLPYAAKEISFNIPLEVMAGAFGIFKWARYQVLAQETAKLDVRYFPEACSAQVPGRQELINNWLGIIKREPSFLLAKIRSRVFSSALEIIRRHVKVGTNGIAPSILILGQQNKCKILCDLLDRNSIGYIYQDIANFNKDVYRAALVKSPVNFCFNYQVDTEESVVAWFIELVKLNRTTLHEGIQLVAKQSPYILLTETPSNYLARGLIAEFNRLGKRVVIYPEGAGVDTDETYRFLKNARLENASEFRFCVSAAELEINESKGLPGIVTGYFTSTYDYSEVTKNTVLTTSWFKSFWRTLAPKFVRPIIFFDLDLYADIGVAYAHLRPDSLALHRTIDGIRALVDRGFKVIANLRHRNFYDSLTSRIAREGFVPYMLAPWQELVNEADVVVVYSSSIGLEALALNKPVVVFDPFEYPTYIDAWSSMESDVVRTASNLEDLVGAVGQLIASPKCDFDKYEQFYAKQQHCAVDWIREVLKDRESNPHTMGVHY